MLLYADYLVDFHKKFQITSTVYTHVEYPVWSFCNNLFLSYADKRHSHTQTNAKNIMFGFSGSQNV